MEYVIAGFDVTFSKLDRPFTLDESTACMELFSAWVTTMNEVLKTKEWYDILGDVYMSYLSGTMKNNGRDNSLPLSTFVISWLK